MQIYIFIALTPLPADRVLFSVVGWISLLNVVSACQTVSRLSVFIKSRIVRDYALLILKKNFYLFFSFISTANMSIQIHVEGTDAGVYVLGLHQRKKLENPETITDLEWVISIMSHGQWALSPSQVTGGKMERRILLFHPDLKI